MFTAIKLPYASSLLTKSKNTDSSRYTYELGMLYFYEYNLESKFIPPK